MGDLNQKLLEFFSTQYMPGLIALVGTSDAIGLAIREAQRPLTKDHRPSLWSHCIDSDLGFGRTMP